MKRSLVVVIIVISTMLGSIVGVNTALAHHKPGHGTTTTTTTTTVPTTTTSSTTTTLPPGTHTVPSSVPADCSVDVTASLNAWIASVPNNSTLTFAGGCFRIEDSLIVDGRFGLTFDGDGATFRATTPGHELRKQWWIKGGADITFTDMTVEGDNLSVLDGAFSIKEFQHLFSFWGTQRPVVDGVVGRYSWGDFVAFEPDYRLPVGDIVAVSGAVVRNSFFDGAGRMGVSANFVDGLTVTRNDFDRVMWSTVDIEVESSTWYARNIVIADNTIRRVRHSFIANSGFNAPTDNVQVLRNVMTAVPDTNQPTIHIDGTPDGLRSHWLIEENTLISRSWLVHADYAADVTFRGNLGFTRNFDPGVALSIANSIGGSITGNELSGRWPETGAFFHTVATFDAASIGWTNCGNRLVPGGAFDQPVLC